MTRALKSITAFVTGLAMFLSVAICDAATWIETPYDRNLLVQTIAYKVNHDVMANFCCTKMEVATVLLGMTFKDMGRWYWIVYRAYDIEQDFRRGVEFLESEAKKQVEFLLMGQRFI